MFMPVHVWFTEEHVDIKYRKQEVCHTEQTSSFRPPPSPPPPASSFTLCLLSFTSIHLSFSSPGPFCKRMPHLFFPPHIFHRHMNLHVAHISYVGIKIKMLDLHLCLLFALPPSPAPFSSFPSVNALFPSAIQIHFQANSHQQMQ